MAAGDSSPFRRMYETPLECRRIRDRAEAVPHGVRGQIDIHVPFEIAVLEPIEHLASSNDKPAWYGKSRLISKMMPVAHGPWRTYQERESIRVGLSRETQAIGRRRCGIAGEFTKRLICSVWLSESKPFQTGI
jgi:hypothetical protein